MEERRKKVNQDSKIWTYLSRTVRVRVEPIRKFVFQTVRPSLIANVTICIEYARKCKGCHGKTLQRRSEIIGLKVHVHLMRIHVATAIARMSQHVRTCACRYQSPKKKGFILYTCYAPPASLLASLSLFVSRRSRFSSPKDQRANMIFLSFSLSAAPCGETRVHYEERKNERAGRRRETRVIARRAE